jgi:ABC-type sugar transport system ATPase subunit
MIRLSARGLSKTYGGVPVLSDMDLDVASGEIRALVGENGAGKSTLIKIISGAAVPDSGRVEIAGVPLVAGDPREARRRGISVVYQEFTLVPELTIAENIFLGRELGRGLLERAEMRRATQQLLDELDVTLDAAAPVRGLSVAHQQLVEIARAINVDAQVLILDEPSATLAQADVERLFGVLRRLAARGMAVIYISHRLEEIFTIADSVTVLRDGRHISTSAVSAMTRDALIRQMVGRSIAEEFPARSAAPGSIMLELAHLSAPPRVFDVSLTVRAGEIVGMAGMVGAGRTSAALASIGALHATGVVRLGGRAVRFGSAADALAAGLAYVTEDRKGRGLFPALGVGENILITHLGQFSRAGVLALGRARRSAHDAVREFAIRTRGLDQRITTLSGGNQQKALLARYLLERPVVLILDEPTRGIDVGARAEIYRMMNRLTADGLGILMISSDLPEVLGMSDRIIVMRAGRTQGELSRAEATPDAVLALATAA